MPIPRRARQESDAERNILSPLVEINRCDRERDSEAEHGQDAYRPRESEGRNVAARRKRESLRATPAKDDDPVNAKAETRAEVAEMRGDEDTRRGGESETTTQKKGGAK